MKYTSSLRWRVKQSLSETWTRDSDRVSSMITFSPYPFARATMGCWPRPLKNWFSGYPRASCPSSLILPRCDRSPAGSDGTPKRSTRGSLVHHADAGLRSLGPFRGTVKGGGWWVRWGRPDTGPRSLRSPGSPIIKRENLTKARCARPTATMRII